MDENPPQAIPQNKNVEKHHTSCGSGLREVLAATNSLQHYLQLKEELYGPDSFWLVPVSVDVGALPKIDGEEHFSSPSKDMHQIVIRGK